MRLQKRNPTRAASGLGDKSCNARRDPLPTLSGLADQDLRRIIGDWLLDWHARAERAQLCLELVGLSTERHDALLREGRALKKLLKHLTERVNHGQ
jgi:hypothetical protein